MNTLTYRQAYDKIIDAYFKDEIKPFDCQFCFCGTLSPNDNWANVPYGLQRRLPEDQYPYTVEEYVKMERALFSVFPKIKTYYPCLPEYSGTAKGYIDGLGGKYEKVLFNGLSAALDVLKNIHKQRGENVDEDIPAFTKRELAKTDIEVVVNN